jgi:hypothetical protein
MKKENKNMKKNIIILIVFIGVIVVWSYLGFSEVNEVDEVTEIADCGEDLNCFIEKSKNCDLAKINYRATIRVFGMEQAVVFFFEIKGMESEKCLFYMRREEIDLKFTSELIQKMLDRGLTEQEIQQQEQESNNLARNQEGATRACSSDTTDLIEEQETQQQEQEKLVKICSFEIADLTEMLIRWERGSFFGGDCELIAENCTEETVF